MTYDAIIIGSGHNGLVTGIYLARNGWKVLVLERNAKPGGAIQTDEITLPGFKHDLYATNLSLFAGSPFHQEFAAELAGHGLEFVPAKYSFGSVFPDKSFIGVSTELEETLAYIKSYSQADAAQWQAMSAAFPQAAEKIFPILAERIPSMGLTKVLLKNIRTGGMEWLMNTTQLFVSSPREFAVTNFTDPRMHALAASWGMHLDFSPDIAGGALFPYLECMANQSFGMVFGKGGAATVVKALCGYFGELGGELRLESEVKQINISANQSTGVTLANGESIQAQRAVIANLAPTVLFNNLIGIEHLPTGFSRKVNAYQYGPGAMTIHLAMRELPGWSAGEDLKKFAYIHIAPYMEDMTQTYNEAMAGLIPSSPLLIVGQTTAVDPGRAPGNQHILSIQVRSLPGKITGDARNEISTTHWNDAKEAFGDRVIDKLAEYAPDVKEKILHRTILSPADLERFNPNLVGGCNIGGSMHLRQNFLFRPFPGWSNYKTPIKNLYMVGASTWPGGGTGAGSGRLLGKMLT